jgi:hypothetical protein
VLTSVDPRGIISSWPIPGRPSGSADTDHQDRTARTAVLVARLHAIVTDLEEMHPGRKFPLDGHLVGSIGEAAAEALFDLTLVATSSTGHDAIAMDGRKVEIKGDLRDEGRRDPEDLTRDSGCADRAEALAVSGSRTRGRVQWTTGGRITGYRCHSEQRAGAHESLSPSLTNDTVLPADRIPRRPTASGLAVLRRNHAGARARG